MRGSAADSSTANRRTLAVAVVGLLVVLSGCLGGEGLGTAPGEQGLAGETATPELQPVEEGDLPPGVDESGVVNATRLLDAHRSVALAENYRVQLDPVAVADAEGGTMVLDRGQSRTRLVRETADGTTTYWASAEDRAVAVDDGSGAVTYATGHSGALDDLLDQSGRTETAVDPYVRYGEFEALGMVEREDGRFLKLQATGIDAAALEASPWQLVDGGQVVDLSGRVLITPEGRIAVADLAVTVETDAGETVTDGFRYEVGQVDDAALERPAWTAEAPQVGADFGENGTALVLTNRGETTIPAETELTVIAGGDVLGTVVVPEPVEPGAKLYVVAVVHDDATRTLHVGLGDRPAVDGHLLSFQRYDRVVAVGGTGDGEFEAGAP